MASLTYSEDRLLDNLKEVLSLTLFESIYDMVDRLDDEIIERDERIEWLTNKLEAMIDTVERLESEIESLQGNLLDK